MTSNYGDSPDPDALLTRGEVQSLVDDVATRKLQEAALGQQVAQEFLTRHPDLAQADPKWLTATAWELGQAHPEFGQKLTTPAGRAEVYDLVADEVRRRVGRIAGPQGRPSSPEEQVRAEAEAEYVEQYQRAKRPPR
jgi:hypothetical protein